LIKRVFDILGAAIGLIVLSPILIAISLMSRREMGSTVRFRQTRPGRLAKPFQMINFRTMRDAIDASGRLFPDGERLTTPGRFLRSSSLGGLSELWNVLKGEMSLADPRLMEYLPPYSPEQARRHEVRHRLRAGEPAQRDLLGREIRPRCLGVSTTEASGGYEDHLVEDSQGY